MARKHKLYQLTEEDIEVFSAGQANANAFTDFYLRTDHKGTTYDPRKDPELYDAVYREWERLGHTNDKFFYDGESWGVVWNQDQPLFKNYHGFRFIPWQLAVHHAMQDMRVVAGGYSSGKSLGLLVSALTLAATVVEFKAMCTAPSWFQAKILYTMAVNEILANTVYEERFLLKAISAPFPILEIGNDHVGVSTIEFRSVADDGESLLSWRGDWTMTDQTELVPDIPRLRNNLGSRLIGQAPSGRSYLGITNWVANAGPSPEFWNLYKEGLERPEGALALTVTTYDNPYNTPKQIRQLEREVGGTKQDIEQWLLAKRPITKGKYFNDKTITLGRARELEQLMELSLKEERPGYIYDEDSTGIYRWFLPYEHGRQYAVIGDPGEGNRPARNSPVVMVWDITDWPNRATLRGFYWMSGNASITPFVNQFTYLVEKYHAHGQCAFDSTSTQKSLDDLAFQFNNLLVEGLNFSQHKAMMLRALQMLMENGLLKYPYIGGWWHQLSNYDLPDTKLQQDIVSCLMMTAFWLRERMGTGVEDEEEAEEYLARDDRFARASADRYERVAARG